MANKPTPAPSAPTRPASTRTNPAEASLNPRTPGRTGPTEEVIRARAYSLWEQAGCPDGDGVRFWLEAEKELSNPR
jgi:Protein of unknown function (DUF2934)